MSFADVQTIWCVGSVVCNGFNIIAMHTDTQCVSNTIGLMNIVETNTLSGNLWRIRRK